MGMGMRMGLPRGRGWRCRKWRGRRAEGEQGWEVLIRNAPYPGLVRRQVPSQRISVLERLGCQEPERSIDVCLASLLVKHPPMFLTFASDVLFVKIISVIHRSPRSRYLMQPITVMTKSAKLPPPSAPDHAPLPRTQIRFHSYPQFQPPDQTSLR